MIHNISIVWQNWGLGSQSRIKFFSILIVYLEGSGKCFQVGVDLPPLSILRNPKWLLLLTPFYNFKKHS